MCVPINQEGGSHEGQTAAELFMKEAWRTFRNITHVLSPGCHCVTCQRYFGRSVCALTLTRSVCDE